MLMLNALHNSETCLCYYNGCLVVPLGDYTLFNCILFSFFLIFCQPRSYVATKAKEKIVALGFQIACTSLASNLLNIIFKCANNLFVQTLYSGR